MHADTITPNIFSRHSPNNDPILHLIDIGDFSKCSGVHEIRKKGGVGGLLSFSEKF